MDVATYMIKNDYIKAKRALFDKYYGSLNEKQREAVCTVEGPLLILAGAGSGKTTVLVNRIGHIIKFGSAYESDIIPDGVTEADVERLRAALSASREEMEAVLSETAVAPCPPWAMLAITFTNKAANEIKHRLESQFDDETVAKDIWAGTFHSICMRILRKYADRAGYLPGFGVADSDDTKKLLAACMRELRIDDKNLPIRTVSNAISRSKDSLMTPEQYTQAAGSDFKYRQIAQIYELYQKRLYDSNLLDFDDIIMKTVMLLEENDDVLDYYRTRFRYICVDEYQDTNKAQLKLTLLLSSRHNNIMVVGDDDQSIYKFRGAVIDNILNFDSMCPGCKVIRLEQNYRSTATILNAANAVIANNDGRKGKNLWTAGAAGEKIRVKTVETENEEARFMISEIQNLVHSMQASYRDFAVLYRVNAQSRVIETAFAKSGIPYRMLGSLRFYDRKEIKDAIAYLCVAVNPSDNLHLLRIVNEPRRKIGEASLEAATAIANELNVPLIDVLRQADKYIAIPKPAAARMVEFAALMDSFAKSSREIPVAALLTRILNESGYRQMLIDAGELDADRLDNIDELISAADAYDKSVEKPDPVEFLEEVALVSDVDRYDETADTVILMTIHSAKGLEFPIVFLPGMEDGIFPGTQSIMNPEEIEEERRLAYVALTRAKRKIYVTHVRTRILYGKTQMFPLSRFIGEIPPELTEVDFYVPSPERAKPQERTQAQRTPRPPRLTRDAQEAFNPKKKEEPDSVNMFRAGDAVRHMMFGTGRILSAKNMGGDVLYEIAFDNVGTKKIMASFAKLKPAE